MREDWKAVQSQVGKYVVYDPPVRGLPYLALLFSPDARPRVFVFETQKEAIAFLTSNAEEPLAGKPKQRQPRQQHNDNADATSDTKPESQVVSHTTTLARQS